MDKKDGYESVLLLSKGRKMRTKHTLTHKPPKNTYWIEKAKEVSLFVVLNKNKNKNKGEIKDYFYGQLDRKIIRNSVNVNFLELMSISIFWYN